MEITALVPRGLVVPLEVRGYKAKPYQGRNGWYTFEMATKVPIRVLRAIVESPFSEPIVDEEEEDKMEEDAGAGGRTTGKRSFRELEDVSSEEEKEEQAADDVIDVEAMEVDRRASAGAESQAPRRSKKQKLMPGH